MAAYRRCRSGAVGGYFVGMLSRAGAPVAMIGRQTFADAVKRQRTLPRYTEFRAHLEFTVAAAHDRCELV